MNTQKKITINGNTERLWWQFEKVTVRNVPDFQDRDAAFDTLKTYELDRDICESWLRGVVGRLAANWPDCEIHVVHHGNPWWAEKGLFWVSENLTKDDEDQVLDIMAGTWNVLHELCVDLEPYSFRAIRAAVREL